MGVESKNPNEFQPGDQSRSYPLSYSFEFPTRFCVSQKPEYLDILMQDEYGNPILCFHAYQWSVKRKFRIIDLRSGEVCGKLVEELKAAGGKYKFNVSLQQGVGSTKKVGSVTKLSSSEAPRLVDQFLVKSHSGIGKFGDDHLGNPIVLPSPLDPNDSPESGSFLRSLVHNVSTDGDTYFLYISPGQDIRLIASMLVSFHTITSSS